MQTVGKEIENLVSSYLQQQGLQLVATNYNCKFGEIDLIMHDDETLVFVEVRYRKDSAYGDGVATVNRRKQNKITKSAAHYLQKNDLYDEVLCRFDVVAVSGDLQKEFDWIKDAFWGKW